MRQSFPRENFIIFDEVHKFKNWRNYIKGLYDKYRKQKKILTTGSARLDSTITHNNKPIQAVECKIKSKGITPSLKYFKAKFPKADCIQVHLNPHQEYESKEGIKSLNWHTFLKDLL